MENESKMHHKIKAVPLKPGLKSKRELRAWLAEKGFEIQTLDSLSPKEFYKLTLKDPLGCVALFTPHYTQIDKETETVKLKRNGDIDFVIGRQIIVQHSGTTARPFPGWGYLLGQKILVKKKQTAC